MTKKILSLLIVLSMFIGIVPVYAEDYTIITNYQFENYATNETVNATGMNARIIENGSKNKVFYTKVWGKPASFAVDSKIPNSPFVFSFDIKVDGELLTGDIFNLGSSSLVNFNSDGTVTLEDGYAISGYKGLWHNYTFVIDPKEKIYSVYVDSKCVVKDWMFSSNITLPSQISLKFTPDNEDRISEIYVDNVFLYTGSKILDKEQLPKPNYNYEVKEYEVQTEKQSYDTIYINSKNGADIKISHTGKTGVAGLSSTPTGVKSFVLQRKDVLTDLFSVVTTGVTEDIPYVYQFDLFPVAMDIGTSCVRAVDTSTSKYSNLIKITPGGTITTGNGKSLGKAPFNKWTNIAISVDPSTSTMDFYLDRVLVASGLALHQGYVKPMTVRHTLDNNSVTGHDEIYYDRIKCYDGNKLRDFNDGEFESTSSSGESLVDAKYSFTTNDSRDMAINLIGSDVVLMMQDDIFYANKEKKAYSKSNITPYTDENGVFMLPATFVKDYIEPSLVVNANSVTYGDITLNAGDKDSLDAPVTLKDGMLYLPVISFSKNILKKYVYEDVRYFCLISNNQKNYVNAPDEDTNLEEIDVVYRYVKYDRPTGDQILQDMKANPSASEHPRIYFKKSEIPAIKAKVASNPEMRKALEALIGKCNGYISSEPVEYVIMNQLRLFGSCYNVRTRLNDLAIAYLLTEDDKYAKCMLRELENCFSWECWNTRAHVGKEDGISYPGHFLDSGKIGPGIAMAYDVLYDWLSPEQKQWIRDKIQEYYLDDCILLYQGDPRHYMNAKDGRITGSNWGAVVGVSMLMNALTFIDEEDENSELTKKCKYIAENALQSLEYPIGHMFPDGNISEGYGYWTYYAEYLGWGINMLLNVCNTDYNLLDSPGLDNTYTEALYLASPLGTIKIENTSGDSISIPNVLYRLLEIYGKDKEAEVLHTFARAVGINLDWSGLLYYTPVDNAGDLLADIGLDNLYKGNNKLQMKGSFTDGDAAYVNVIGGRNQQIGVCHFDKGSFSFDAGGVRWFEDVGSDDYNITDGWGGPRGYSRYVRRTEGHNSLTINNADADPGQVYLQTARFNRFESKNRGAIAVIDLLDVYGTDKVSKYERGYLFSDDRETLVVQDELVLTKPNSTLLYSFHTAEPESYEFAPDGKTVYIKKNGKTLKVEFETNADEWKLEKRNADPENLNLIADSSNGKVGEKDRSKYKKLVFVGKHTGELRISVKMSLADGNSYPSYSYVPMSQWTIPEGIIDPKPTVEDILLNGVSYSQFNPSITSYKVDINHGEPIPTISAVSNDGIISVEKDSNNENKFFVKSTSKSGKQKIYVLEFNPTVVTVGNIRIMNDLVKTNLTTNMPSDYEFIKAVATNASYIPQPKNSPENTQDGDIASYWASDIHGNYLIVDLGEVKDLYGVATAHKFGTGRNYSFDVLISEDGINYYKVFNGGNTSESDDYEFIELNKKARYIRYVGYGHSAGEWSSLAEFRACARK